MIDSVISSLSECIGAAFSWFWSFDEVFGVGGMVLGFLLAALILRFILGPLFGFHSLSDSATKRMKNLGVNATKPPKTKWNPHAKLKNSGD